METSELLDLLEQGMSCEDIARDYYGYGLEKED